MAEDQKATVHLLCGLPGTGRTTIARRLESEGAVRFTLDEWMLRLFDLTPDQAEYGVRTERVCELIWDLTAPFVRGGHDVVLDWSQWNPARRERPSERARRARPA